MKKTGILLPIFSLPSKYGIGTFMPSKIDTIKENVETQKIVIGEREYLFSLCCEKGSTINYYHNINII